MNDIGNGITGVMSDRSIVWLVRYYLLCKQGLSHTGATYQATQHCGFGPPDAEIIRSCAQAIAARCE